MRWKIIDLAIFGGAIAFLFVFFLLVFHSYLVLTNQTTIEIRGRGGIRQVMTGKAKTYKLPSAGHGSGHYAGKSEITPPKNCASIQGTPLAVW